MTTVTGHALKMATLFGCHDPVRLELLVFKLGKGGAHAAPKSQAAHQPDGEHWPARHRDAEMKET